MCYLKPSFVPTSTCEPVLRRCKNTWGTNDHLFHSWTERLFHQIQYLVLLHRFDSSAPVQKKTGTAIQTKLNTVSASPDLRAQNEQIVKDSLQKGRLAARSGRVVHLHRLGIVCTGAKEPNLPAGTGHLLSMFSAEPPRGAPRPGGLCTVLAFAPREPD